MKLLVGALAGTMLIGVISCGGGGGAADGSSVTGPSGSGNSVTPCPANTVCMLFSTGGAYDTGTGTFSPNALTVTHGATVSFSNSSGVAHNVVFDTPGVPGGDIGVIGSGSQQRTFPNAGNFAFHCTVHEGMSGTIAVQ